MTAFETLDPLLVMAEKLSLLADSDPSWDSALEQYSQTFDQWYEHWDSIKVEVAQNQALRSKVERLDELHKLLISRAQSLHGQVAEDLRQLKRKGKGILAYTDVMPRSIQTMRGKKG